MTFWRRLREWWERQWAEFERHDRVSQRWRDSLRAEEPWVGVTWDAEALKRQKDKESIHA